MILLRQKIYATLADGSGYSISTAKQEWLSGGGKDKLGGFTDFYHWKINTLNNNINTAAATRATERAANQAFAKTNPNALKGVATRARTQGYNKGVAQGFAQGQQSVGIMGGIKNSWNNAGTMGKAGMAGAGLLATGLAVKGVSSMFRNKNKDNER